MFGWESEASSLRLALEAREALGVLRERGGQRLDRDVAPEPRVAGAIHLAHAARAERRDDLVGAEAGAGGQGHRGTLTERLAIADLEHVRAPLDARFEAW